MCHCLSVKPRHHNTADVDKLTIHGFAFVVSFGFRFNTMLQPILVKRHTYWLYLASFDREVAAQIREQRTVVREQVCPVGK